MKKIILTLFVFALACVASEARPQWSLLQGFGTGCQNCHVNTQGGGVRNNPGWMSRKDISMINPKSIGLGSVYDAVGKGNTFAGELITVGADIRYQSARWPDGAFGRTVRDAMLMQCSPYLVVKPAEWIFVEGFYNLAYDLEDDKRYPGQMSYAVSATIKPSENLPQLRVGHFQPTIGTKYDDHTLLIRRVANGRAPLIPDDYAEWGAQIDYESLKIWKLRFGFSAGLFDTKNMLKLGSLTTKTGKVVPIVDSNSVSKVFRAACYPEFSGSINTFFGGYYMFNGDYKISDAFFNIGLADRVCLMTEYMRSEKDDARMTQNFLIEADYQLKDWLIPYVRFERGQTAIYAENTPGATYPYYTNQYVIGAHIFVLPYIEFLPEYRIADKEQIPGEFKQWAFQIHLFY